MLLQLDVAVLHREELPVGVAEDDEEEEPLVAPELLPLLVELPVE